MATSFAGRAVKLVPPLLIGFAAYVVAYSRLPAGSGDTREVTQVAQVLLVSRPPGAQVSRDGNELGTAPLVVEVARGTETITFHAQFSDGRQIEQTVTPDGKVVSVVFLLAEAQAPGGDTDAGPPDAETRADAAGKDKPRHRHRHDPGGGDDGDTE